MYSIVMVVAMAGAPENPAFCCKGKGNWGGDCWSSKSFCCKKDYSCAKNDCAPVHAAPVHAVPAAPCHNDCDTGYKSKGCCFFDKCGWGSKCGKGYNNGCDTGYKSKGCCFFDKCGKGGYSSKCDKGYNDGCDNGYKSKGCCFFGKCCDKGYDYAPTSDCGSTVVPVAPGAPVAPVAPKKDMPKTGPAPKVGG